VLCWRVPSWALLPDIVCVHSHPLGGGSAAEGARFWSSHIVGRPRPDEQGVAVMNSRPEHLLKMRLVVARVGEMDLARWWNTTGQLGPLGASVLRRGFRRTHYFAQARSVFAVAAHRCREVYDRPGTVTLWNLPAETEDEFELRWEEWLDHSPAWELFFEQLTSCSADLETDLLRLQLVTEADLENSRKLRRSAEQRAVQLPCAARILDWGGSPALLPT
jgi:hypothetical protein